MMSGGLLNAIFATSTVAAGVDFPARTVVISNADVRGNEGWRPLKASELQQMTGRAGVAERTMLALSFSFRDSFKIRKRSPSCLKLRPTL